MILDSTMRLDDVLAGGASSPVRAGRRVGGAPFVCARADGPYAYDVEGRRYVDYVMAYGPLLFGHTPPFLHGLDALAARGVVYGSTTPDELELAARIRGHLPSMEKLRFTTTGSEAVQSAVRVARAFTGRDAVLKFSGNYHGHFDLALQDAGASAETPDATHSGIPRAVVADLAVARYNDLDDVDRHLARIGDRLAAILVEPICGNMGLVETEPGFLQGLRERADRHGALLIFDEVITWLRLGLAGAQGELGVVPDLTAVGKIMGGGFPIAAFGGRADVMAVLAPEGPCFTGGTHAGMPFAVALALRVLDYLETTPSLYREMDRRARILADGIRATLRDLGLDYAVVQRDSIVDFKFRPGPPTRSYDDQARDDQRAYAAFYHAMRARGVLLPPSHNEVMFVSTVHGDDDVELTVDAIDESLRALRAEGVV
ncbi:MAG: glutamate-1-semialdehyde 2,1-aminomutase [Candidatus Eremiobacteraeota bacterium]|nr:glutamate-1-semialdehyde 2,1-aminomutase [Candidatus Eremiobacteraeota bacterium]MBV9408092.1 glutamate-1-semialdehyde 2,1-aminomutase [Candidatus Eremiobacteraeota bacterium]